MAIDDTPTTLLLTSEIISAYVGKNPVAVHELPHLIREVHKTLKEIDNPSAPVEEIKALEPAVPIKKSITPDYIICLEDGKKFKSLKRHLRGLGLSPEEYREKWGLPENYPMVSPNYSKVRSKLAKDNGLGTKP